MANRWAIKNGNWSDPTTWDSGLGVPTTGDVVGANGYTVTIDQDVSVAEIKTTAVGSGIAGGTFLVTVTSGTRTITCSVGLTPGTSHCLQANISAGATLIINGTLYGGSTAVDNRYTVVGTGSGLITVNGVGGLACRFAQNTWATSLYLNGPSAEVYGDITPQGGAHGTRGIYNVSSGNVSVVATTVQGGGGDGAHAIWNASTGTVSITANVVAGGSGTAGSAILNSSGGSVWITATDLQGGTSSTSHGVANSSAGTVIVSATRISGKVGNAVYSTSNGFLRVTGTCRADYAPAIYWVGANSYCELIGNAIGCYEYPSDWGKIGINAVVAYRLAIRANLSQSIAYCESDGNWGYNRRAVYYYTPLAGATGHPSISNVRSGTQYGPNNELTGTCAVPAPQSVLYGVPVDDTVGTATLSASDIASAVWGALRTNYTTSGTFGAVSEWASTLTAGAVADAVWDESRADHTTDGTFGAVSEWATPTGITPQEVRDAMLMAPTEGSPADKSIDAYLQEIKARTDLLGSGSVTVRSSVAEDGQTVRIVRGDDYLTARGRALRFTFAAGAADDLTDATVAFTARRKSDDSVLLESIGTVIQSGAGPQIVDVEVTHTQTSTLPVGAGIAWYDLEADYGGIYQTQITRGELTVVRDETRHIS